MDSICCLLHSMVPGGSGWQWVRLLGRHVEGGGRATIFAPPGPLAEPARAAGIEVTTTQWDAGDLAERADLWAAVGRHRLAIVHWEQGLMEAFGPALEACGRAALAVHQSPRAMRRWFGPPTLRAARIALERAVDEKHAVALVRGEAHRRRVAGAFGVDPAALRILPASVPLRPDPFQTAPAPPAQILALMRLSPEKAAVAQLAVQLVRERLDNGNRCQLTIAGEGPWRPHAVALCEQRLPAGSWRIEGAPEDPIARLAASDLVVAQGLTTLEAASLGRRVIVARAAGEDAAAGAALTPDSYDEAARDPFGEPAVTSDAGQIWEDVLRVGEEDLRALRHQVEIGNSLEVASQALGEALATTAGPIGRLARRLRR